MAASRAVDAGAKNTMGDRQWFVLYLVVCLEVGIFLLLVPWSAVWERNYFLEAYPSLRAILLAPAIRGAVAGLGLANIYMGLSEVLNRRRTALRGNQRGEGTSPPHQRPVVASDDRA